MLPITAPGSVSSVVEGALVNLAYTQYPGIEKTIMALEFGTLDSMQVMQALRADHWMHRHPDVPADTRAEIRQGLRDAFYCDSPDWKGGLRPDPRGGAAVGGGAGAPRPRLTRSGRGGPPAREAAARPPGRTYPSSPVRRGGSRAV